MNYLFLLLIPIGITLAVISGKHIFRSATAEMVYEIPCSKGEGVFRISEKGNYGIWISGKLFSKSPVGDFGFNVINQQTGNKIPLSLILMRTSVNGFKTARLELYSFYAEEGTYVISLDGESNAFDKGIAAVRNTIIQKPIDYSLYSVQIRKHSPVYVLFLSIFGLIFGIMATLLGIVLPIALK